MMKEYYTFEDEPCRHTDSCLGAKLMRLAPITNRQEELLSRLESEESDIVSGSVLLKEGARDRSIEDDRKRRTKLCEPLLEVWPLPRGFAGLREARLIPGHRPRVPEGRGGRGCISGCVSEGSVCVSEGSGCV